MSDLVFIQGDNAVTSSLIVADVFLKEHKHVLRDIKELGCSEEFRQSNFGLSTYTNSQNKEMPMYYLNKKSFTLLAMGYTGETAMRFKEKYIEQFEEMEEIIRKNSIPKMSQVQMVNVLSSEMIKQEERLSLLEDRVNEQITLDHGQVQSLNQSIKNRVESIKDEYPGVDKRLLYSRIHKNLRSAFSVPSFRVVKKKDYEDSISWVKYWRPLL